MIEVIAQIDLGGGTHLEQRVAGLEDDAGAAQVMEIGAELRIDQARQGGQFALGLVVIEYEDIDPLGAQARRFPRRNRCRNRAPASSCG